MLFGANGVLSRKAQSPKIVVDSTSISLEESAEIREKLEKEGVKFLAAPVSGNAKVIKAGKLTVVASGPQDAIDAVSPYLAAIGQGVSYVGDGELSRIAKICHNVMLGVVIQIARARSPSSPQKAGMKRHAFLDFLNKSVMGSMFTRYKTPALANLDFHVTFTPELLRKDLDLGLARGQDARRADAARLAHARHGADADRQRLRGPGFLDAAAARGEGLGHRAQARERRSRRRAIES